MLLVDHPTSFGRNVLQRPAQVDGIQAKMGEWVCLVFHPSSPSPELDQPGTERDDHQDTHLLMRTKPDARRPLRIYEFTP
jgi:hypothetical protein